MQTFFKNHSNDNWQPGSPLLVSVVFCPLLTWIVLAIGFAFPKAVIADGELHYKVSIQGIIDRELRKTLEAVSDVFTLRKRPPASLSLLQRRVDRDIPQLIKVLKSQGYYGAKVTAEIEGKAKPIRVTFRVDPGSAYLLQAVDITPEGKSESLRERLPGAGDIGLTLAKPARNKSILSAEKLLIRWFKKNGFPFPRMSDRRVVVDHKTRSVSVTFRIHAGPPARFGPTEVFGLQSVDEALVGGKIPWKEGDRFNIALLEEAEKHLIATDLFATVEVKPHEDLDERGYLPVAISVKERKHRTIKAGVSYSTDEGPGAKVSWEHRNFLGGGEHLSLVGTASQITYATEGEFLRPDFMRRDQSLLLNVRMAEDHPDAFTSRSLSSSFQIERVLRKEMKVWGGLAYKASQVEQFEAEERFGLLSIPMRLSWDTSQNLLDPVEGGRFTFQLAPFWDTFGADLGFVKAYASSTHYLKLSKRPFSVLAGRVAFGAIAGETRQTIPADERFYAGGGGSIRGYAFQSVGPLEGNEPIGGRSLVELSVELRAKVTETIGLVLFVDGGTALSAVIPDFEEPLRFGTGVGLRYFTPIGPLRLDIGVPINRREGVDDRFQIYVSLGQAF